MAGYRLGGKVLVEVARYRIGGRVQGRWPATEEVTRTDKMAGTR